MTKQEILEYFKDINYYYNECSRYDDLNRMLDKLIEDTIKRSGVNFQVAFDREELQRCVDKAKEEIKEGIIAGFIDDLKEIYEKLWDVKISAPNIIEHREHYKQIQDITADVEEKLKKYQEAGREET
jgi:hypothetical protein